MLTVLPANSTLDDTLEHLCRTAFELDQVKPFVSTTRDFAHHRGHGMHDEFADLFDTCASHWVEYLFPPSCDLRCPRSTSSGTNGCAGVLRLIRGSHMQIYNDNGDSVLPTSEQYATFARDFADTFLFPFPTQLRGMLRRRFHTISPPTSA
jgi:hypothetical protein